MNQIQLAEALKLSDKTQCNVVCLVGEMNLKTGPKSTYWNGLIHGEDGAKCYLSSFTNFAMKPYEGKKVVLVGAQVSHYNGKVNMTLGKQGSVQDWNPDLEAAPPHQAPQRAQSQPTHTQTAPSGQIHAATACWAVGKAVELVIAGKENDVEATARHLLAIQQRIEQGETSVPF